MRGPLAQAEYEQIYSRVPRLTVEVVIAGDDGSVLLALRETGPCRGLWHLPGGTVRFGEPVVDAVERVARAELGATVTVGQLLGYIEYPSHYNNGLDSPVGLAFAAERSTVEGLPDGCRWFSELPANMHDEQRQFVAEHQLGQLAPSRDRTHRESGR